MVYECGTHWFLLQCLLFTRLLTLYRFSYWHCWIWILYGSWGIARVAISLKWHKQSQDGSNPGIYTDSMAQMPKSIVGSVQSLLANLCLTMRFFLSGDDMIHINLIWSTICISAFEPSMAGRDCVGVLIGPDRASIRLQFVHGSTTLTIEPGLGDSFWTTIR